MNMNNAETSKYKTREEWLVAAVKHLSEHFRDTVGQDLPSVRVSVGWPGGRRKGKGTVAGQCWASKAAADGVSQVFISPTLGDAATVLHILVHELVHALDDCASGHRGNFVRWGKAVGLVAPWTATTPGDPLREHLAAIADALGDYPHAALNPGLSGVKKQGTRMLKVECPCCGYTCRTTAKWIEAGLPSCPFGTEMELA